MDILIAFNLMLLCPAGLIVQAPAPSTNPPALQAQTPKAVELTTSMAIDVDGAPNAYGPRGKPALDFELNAHEGARASGEIVGYLTKADGRTPELQGPQDPFPGYYISTTSFQDESNPNRLDPRKYVDATKINYVVLGRFAAKSGAKPGDFVAVYSKQTGKSVFGIIGDSGNSSGAEGSLALLQALGYAFSDGKTGGIEQKDIVIRYFPGSNSSRHFFKSQAELDHAATLIGLSKDFAMQRQSALGDRDPAASHHSALRGMQSTPTRQSFCHGNLKPT